VYLNFVCDMIFLIGCKCSVEVQNTWSFSSAALIWFSGSLMRMGTTLVFNVTKYLFFLQEDYRLLETMNRVTITKYSDMKQIAGNVARTMIDLNEKCK
jgi:biogenesis of lysosome-related organelles complex 1 subunit 2